MRPGPRLAAVLLLVVVSLGLKLALYRPDTSAREAERRAWAGQRAAALMEGAGLSAVISPADPSFVTGTAETCSAIVTVVSAEGWQSATLDRLAGADGQVMVVHRHQVHDRHPVVATWWEHHRERLVRFLGREPPDEPVFGIVQTPGCAGRDIPWHRLGDR